MQITLVPDNSIASAPAGLTAAVEAAASVFEQDFPGNYNVNISYGWGTFNNAPSDVLTNPSAGAFSLGGGPLSSVSYSELKDWLTANAVSTAQITAVASLPASAASLPDDPRVSPSAPQRRKRSAFLVGTAAQSTAQSDSMSGTPARPRTGSQRPCARSPMPWAGTPPPKAAPFPTSRICFVIHRLDTTNGRPGNPLTSRSTAAIQIWLILAQASIKHCSLICLLTTH